MNLRRRGWLFAATIVAAACLSATGVSADSKQADDAPAESERSRAELERQFAERLAGVVFDGQYSVTASGEEKPAQMEKYTIAKVAKQKDDYWLFSTRIQYGKTDLALPLVLQVKWAGDTPVITLTDFTIPGLGTFTSRVMIYGDRYAGTWQHDNVGGHLWGRIKRLDPSDRTEADKPQPRRDAAPR